MPPNSQGPSTPSKVLHVRNLPEECNEMDIRSLCRQFGNINKWFPPPLPIFSPLLTPSFPLSTIFFNVSLALSFSLPLLLEVCWYKRFDCHVAILKIQRPFPHLSTYSAVSQPSHTHYLLLSRTFEADYPPQEVWPLLSSLSSCSISLSVPSHRSVFGM